MLKQLEADPMRSWRFAIECARSAQWIQSGTRIAAPQRVQMIPAAANAFAAEGVTR